MCAELAFRQADGFDQRFELVEPQRGEAEPLADDVDHLPVLGRVGRGVTLQVFVGVAFQLADDAAGNQLHVAFGRGEAYVGTAVDERRTGNAHMYLAHTIVEEHADVVAELCAAHDAVVAEEHALAAQYVAVGDEFHLGDQRTHFLVGRGETAGPGGRVFGDGALVGLAYAGSIAQCHAHSGVGNAADAVHFSLVFTRHHLPVVKPHFLDVAPFVGGGGETVVHPQEGTYLHVVLRGAELLDAAGTQPHHLAGAEETVGFVAEIGEGRAFGCGCIGSVFLPYDDGRAAPVVAGGDDAVLGEQEHGAGAVNVAEHVFYAFDKCLSLDEEQGNEFCLVRLARGKLGKVHVLL